MREFFVAQRRGRRRSEQGGARWPLAPRPIVLVVSVLVIKALYTMSEVTDCSRSSGPATSSAHQQAGPAGHARPRPLSRQPLPLPARVGLQTCSGWRASTSQAPLSRRSLHGLQRKLLCGSLFHQCSRWPSPQHSLQPLPCAGDGLVAPAAPARPASALTRGSRSRRQLEDESHEPGRPRASWRRASGPRPQLRRGIVFPPHPFIGPVGEIIKDTKLNLGSQSIFEDKGACTAPCRRRWSSR